MAEVYRYVFDEPVVCLYSSITEKSKPKSVGDAEPKFGATYAVGDKDWQPIVNIMVQALKTELSIGEVNPNDFHLACMGGKKAAERVIAMAELNCAKQGVTEDEKFKIRERAAKRAELYRQYKGILTTSSKFDIELAYIKDGKVVDVGESEHARAQAGKDMFYSGSFQVPSVAFKAYRRKTVDAKDGVTCFLQNSLFIRKGPKIAGGGGPSNNEVFGKYAGYTAEDPTAMAPTGGENKPAEDAPEF